MIVCKKCVFFALNFHFILTVLNVLVIIELYVYLVLWNQYKKNKPHLF